MISTERLKDLMKPRQHPAAEAERTLIYWSATRPLSWYYRLKIWRNMRSLKGTVD